MEWGTKAWFQSKIDLQGFDTATAYFGHRQNAFQNFRHMWITDQVRKIVAETGAQHLVDLGCATGELLGRIQNSNPELDLRGYDFVKDLVQKAEQMYPNIKFGINALPSVPHLPKAPTVVVLADVLYYLPKDQQIACIKELKEKLAPGSSILMSSVIGEDYFTPISALDTFKTNENEAQMFLLRLPIYKHLYKLLIGLAALRDKALAPALANERKLIGWTRKVFNLPGGKQVSNLLAGFTTLLIGSDFLPKVSYALGKPLGRLIPASNMSLVVHVTF